MNAVGQMKTVSEQERCFHPFRHFALSAALTAGGAVAAILLASPVPVQAQNGATTSAASPPAAAAPAATKKSSGKASAGAATAKSPANEKSQASYSIGVSMGEQLHHVGLSSETVSVERIAQGIRDALTGKATMKQEDQERIGALVRTVRASMGEKNHAAAKAFLAENGKKKDVVTTASGLQYHIVNEGSGTPPKPTDEVTVNYRGTLLDGTEFDSSYKRGQPASFPANGVIPGWQEALVLMKPGSKWELFIPPNLAYDLNSPTPMIPPGSLLKFDVELISAKAQPPAPAPGAPGASGGAKPPKPQQ